MEHTPLVATPPPVLLLHGFTGSADAWGSQILAALRARGPVIAVDLPGHGGHEAPEDPGRSRIHCVVKEVTRQLDDRGIERADWVGYSMGGRVALAAAILRPGRVGRLVLESASPGIRDEAERAARRAEDDALAGEIEARGIEWFVDGWESNPLFAGEGREAHLRMIRLRNRPEALARILRGLGAGSQPSFWDRLSEVRIPTLVLTGAEDAKYHAIGAEMAAALREADDGGQDSARARHVSIPKAGHAVHREAPEAWIREVLAFLG